MASFIWMLLTEPTCNQHLVLRSLKGEVSKPECTVQASRFPPPRGSAS
ncbi:MAG: hypothetical protein QOG06_2031 [Gaiellaceae bacterium]|nr:hypothetical protein [Gaiellaceae bacterium]